MNKYIRFFAILVVVFAVSYIYCFNYIRPFELKAKEAAEIINNMPSIDLSELIVETDGNIEKATRFTFKSDDLTPNHTKSILRYKGIVINNYKELKKALGENYVGDSISLNYFDKANSAILYISDKDYALGGNLVITKMNFPVKNKYKSLPMVFGGFLGGFTDPFGIVVAEANLDDEVALVRAVRLAIPTTAAFAIMLLLLPLVASIVWQNKKIIVISIIIYSLLGAFKIMNFLFMSMQ